jgi:hypothetical protein
MKRLKPQKIGQMMMWSCMGMGYFNLGSSLDGEPTLKTIVMVLPGLIGLYWWLRQTTPLPPSPWLGRKESEGPMTERRSEPLDHRRSP